MWVSDLVTSTKLNQLQGLRIACRTTGSLSDEGRRRGGSIGRGLEFADYRAYYPGADPRHIDWKVYARLGKLFLRLFHSEGGLNILLLLDTSRSMDFGDGFKIEVSKGIALILAFLGMKSEDRVGLATFSDGIQELLLPKQGTGQFAEIRRSLDKVAPSGKTNLKQCLQEIQAFRNRFTVVVLISDFFDPAGFEPGLDRLGIGHQGALIQVLHQRELLPEPVHEQEIRDIESESEPGIPSGEGSIGMYLKNLRGFNLQLQDYARRRGFLYSQTNTAMSFEETLFSLRDAGLVE